jgi:predicted kinase
MGCRFLVLACEADSATLAQRIEKRALLRSDPSDADMEVLSRQLQIRESLAAEELATAIRIDTTQAKASEQAIAAIYERLGQSDPAAHK